MLEICKIKLLRCQTNAESLVCLQRSNLDGHDALGVSKRLCVIFCVTSSLRESICVVFKVDQMPVSNKRVATAIHSVHGDKLGTALLKLCGSDDGRVASQSYCAFLSASVDK